MLMVVAALALPAPVQDAQAAIEAALADSAAGWSAGDMPRFLAIYADDAVFVTKNGLVRGKAAIAARYDKSYGADASKRGALSFRILGARTVDTTHRVLWAEWQLAYPDGRSDKGVTSLLFEMQARGWKIIADHSS